MTENQLRYLAHQETLRHNRATESQNADALSETARSNLAREQETNRSNVAKESETHRANVAHEAETNRSNVAKETETNRANVAHESETHRANVQNEILKGIAANQKNLDILVDGMGVGAKLLDALLPF